MNQRDGLTRIGDSYISLNELDLAEASYRKAITMGYQRMHTWEFQKFMQGKMIPILSSSDTFSRKRAFKYLPMTGRG